jgi:hypothetical protein
MGGHLHTMELKLPLAYLRCRDIKIIILKIIISQNVRFYVNTCHKIHTTFLIWVMKSERFNKHRRIHSNTEHTETQKNRIHRNTEYTETQIAQKHIMHRNTEYTETRNTHKHRWHRNTE